jgi:putative transposase
VTRFRLYPDPQQEILLREHCAHARFVWNLALEQRNCWHRYRGGAAPDLVAQARQLTEARAAEPWLAAGSVTVQQQALRDHDQAWRNFWAGTHRRPTWRKQGQAEGFQIVGRPALRIRHESRRWSAVLVPKVGWVRFRRTRAFAGWKSYRVTWKAGRWHIAFAIIPKPIPVPGTGEIVGVDRGVKVAAALSTGELSSPAGLQPKEAERRRRLERRLARARRGSNRRAKVKLDLARLRAREADRRKDWAEKLSTRLARDFDVIRFEKLPVKTMTRSARGTVADPGTRVRQKTGLNRGILAAGWSLLRTRTEHKAPGRVEDVDPAYTSQQCSVCGHTARDNRESQAVFRCVACGHRAHADVNAARNIAAGGTAAGRVVAARGGSGLPVPVKREPSHERLLHGV